MRCRARGRAAAARRRCARRRVNREREAARRRARSGAGVSGGAGEGARTRSNGRFTRVVNRKAASPSSATPRGSIEYPRGGAHERVELLAARGQRLRAHGKRVERRGAQQQGSSVRRPQCCGDGGARCEECCPMHLSFMSRSPQCCNYLGVSLASPLCCSRAKPSNTRAKRRSVPTAGSKAKRCAEEWSAKKSNTGPNGSPDDGRACNELVLQHTSARGLPIRQRSSRTRFKAALSNGTHDGDGLPRYKDCCPGG